MSGIFGRVGKALWNSDEFEKETNEKAAESAALSDVTDNDIASAEVSVSGTAAASITGVDFPELYSRDGVAGDPNTDQLLEAFAGMSGMDETAKRTAMGAMTKAMRADVDAVSGTLNQRLKVLQAAVDTERKAVGERKSTRDTEFEDYRKETEQQVADLLVSVERLKSGLADQEHKAQQKTASDEGALRGFVARAGAEAIRLTALVEFFGASAPKGKGK